MFVVPNRRKFAFACVGVAVVAASLWTAYALTHKPVLVHTLGDWDCACGDMYVKTTMLCVWNPFRDRQPEIVADSFLSKLRANACTSVDDVCRASLPAHRVSAWQLSYRDDQGDSASLFYKLTKYGDTGPFRGSVGAITLRKARAGWRVVGFDAYF